MQELLTFEKYKTRIKEILIGEKIPENSADTVADYMASSDFYGVTSHGARTLGAHIGKIRKGEYNLSPSFTVEKEFPAFAVINGDNAIGMVSAVHAVDYAIEKAKTTGIFTVFSHTNNTYGASFYYALRGAKAGFACITASNSPAQMAPIGGTDKLLGTNPFAIAIPAKSESPLVIDMATSVVAKSKFKEYKEAGKALPLGWALDSNGNPTTDPDAAMAGLVLPMAGFKGYGISLMIDAIAGFMSGAKFLGNVGRFYNSDGSGMGVGFYFTVMSPELIYGSSFYSNFDEYIRTLRNSTAREGCEILIPGDDRVKVFENNIKNGIIFDFDCEKI